MVKFKAGIHRIFVEKSLFIRVQAFIGFIIMASILITGFTYSSRFEKIVIDNFTKSNQITLKEINVAMNLIIENIIDISKQVYDDDTLRSIMEDGYVKDYNSSLQLDKKVMQVKFSNRYIESVYVYMSRSNMIFSSEYGLTDLDTFQDKQFLEWFNSDTPNLSLTETHPITPALQEQDPVHVLSVNTRLPWKGVLNFNGAIIINIRQSVIYDQVINKMNDENEVPFFIVNRDKRIIFAKDQGDLYKDIYSLDYFATAMDENSGSYVSQVNGRSHLVVYNTDEARQWTYISAYPFDGVFNTINSIKRLAVLISIFMAILSLAISALYTLRTFKPVEDLTRFILSKGRQKGKRMGQLSYIKEAVLDVYQNNSEMQEKLDAMQPVFRDRFLYNLIRGDHGSLEEIEGRLRFFGIDIPTEQLVLSSFQWDGNMDAELGANQDEDVIKFLVVHSMEGFLVEKGLKAFCLESPNDTITVVIAKGDRKMGDLVAMLKELQQEISRIHGLSFTIGICDTEMSITQLGNSYKMAREALKYKILYGKGDIVLYSDVKQEGDTQYSYPYDKEEFLKNYIRVCDRESAKTILREMLEEVRRNSSASYFSIYQLIIQLNNAMINLLSEVNISLEVVYRNQNVVQKIFHLQSIDEIEFFFASIIDKIVLILQGHRDTKTEKHYKNILAYVESNYHRELSLETVSEEINLSPSYINQILKSVSEKTFIQLLNETRIEKACALLVQGHVKIKDVAEQVGFSSSKYFITIFKELKGVTPGMFKG